METTWDWATIILAISIYGIVLSGMICAVGFGLQAIYYEIPKWKRPWLYTIQMWLTRGGTLLGFGSLLVFLAMLLFLVIGPIITSHTTHIKN